VITAIERKGLKNKKSLLATFEINMCDYLLHSEPCFFYAGISIMIKVKNYLCLQVSGHSKWVLPLLIYVQGIIMVMHVLKKDLCTVIRLFNNYIIPMHRFRRNAYRLDGYAVAIMINGRYSGTGKIDRIGRNILLYITMVFGTRNHDK